MTTQSPPAPRADGTGDALLVIDVQRGFDDPVWGRRNNPSCEQNVARLIAAWRDRDEPVVFVRHDSVLPDSPLRPGRPGNDFKDVVSGTPDLLVAKSVNSAFLGGPDLHGWLGGRGIGRITVCGIQTNFCCETTARMGANLGYVVRFVADATHTFDLPRPGGGSFSADAVAEMTCANLQFEFAQVVSTDEVLRVPRR
jgi:nicotinamidase-related amidase